jgi:HlyD family secretion protein
LAKDETRRLVDLGDKAPGEQLARQRLVQKAAELELESVRSRLTTLQTTIQLRRDQARSQSETALANSKRLETSVAVKSAEKNIERVKAKLNLATIRAPQDGRVLKVFVHAGEAVGPKPVLQLADTEKVYVNAEVYESDLRRVKVGQKATIENAALPQAFHGVVEKVLWTVSQDGLRSIDPTAPSDLRVVPVKVRINDDEVATHRELLTRLINLQVDVYIEVGDDS